jgi:6-pyruvoyltetrahydropterin/6-carboxytetrahydropterin synthase
MFQLGVERDFIAQHYLIGGDWGAENQLHSHHYRLEVILQGEELDEHGYLVDIVAVEQALDEQVAQYRDRTLNDLPPFRGLNPSLERFCRLLCEALCVRLQAPTLAKITVKLWENEIAWAAYTLEV